MRRRIEMHTPTPLTHASPVPSPPSWIRRPMAMQPQHLSNKSISPPLNSLARLLGALLLIVMMNLHTCWIEIGGQISTTRLVAGQATGEWSSLTTFISDSATGCQFLAVIQDRRVPTTWICGCTDVQTGEQSPVAPIVLYSSLTNEIEFVGARPNQSSIRFLAQNPLNGDIIFSDGDSTGLAIFRTPYNNASLPETLLTQDECGVNNILINQDGIMFVGCIGTDGPDSVIQYNLTSHHRESLMTADVCDNPIKLRFDGDQHLLIGCGDDGVYSLTIITPNTPSPPPPPVLVVNDFGLYFEDAYRLENSSDFIVLCSQLGLIRTNGTFLPPPFFPTQSICTYIDQFQYQPLYDSIIFTCSDMVSAAALLIQGVSAASAGQASLEIAAITLTDTCNDVGVILADYTNPNRYILYCNGGTSTGVVATDGRDVTTVATVTSCGTIGPFVIDPSTGAIIMACGNINGYGNVVHSFGQYNQTMMPISLICPVPLSVVEADQMIFVACAPSRDPDDSPITSVYTFPLSGGSWHSIEWLFNVSYPIVLFANSADQLFATKVTEGDSPGIVLYYNGTGAEVVLPPEQCPGLGRLVFPNSSVVFIQCQTFVLSLPSMPPFGTPHVLLNQTEYIRDMDFYVDRNQLWLITFRRLLSYDVITHEQMNISLPFDYCDQLTLNQLSNQIFLTCTKDNIPIILMIDALTRQILQPLLPAGHCSANQLLLDPVTSTLYLSCYSGSLYALSQHFQCQVGWQWMGDGCLPCSPGTARGFMNLIAGYIPSCQACTPGSIAIFSGSGQCDSCPSGRYQDLIMGEGICAYCQPGKYQAQPGETSCLDCSSGTYSSDIGYTICWSCPPGSYTVQNRSTTCVACDRGTASNSTGLNSTCPQCMPGTEQTQYGGTICVSCQLGSYAPAGESCSGCPLNSYQPYVGHECLPCSQKDQDGLICQDGLALVKPGWWAYQYYESDSNEWIYRTTSCPPDYCLGSPLQLANSSSANGTDSSIQLCQFPRLNSPDNWLCADCADGYIVWGQSCTDCSGSHIGVILLLLFLSFLLVGFLLRSGTQAAGYLDILLYFIQIAALELASTTSQDSTSIQWLQALNLNFLSFNSCFAQLTPLQQTLLTYLTPFILTIILAVIGLIHWFLTRCVCRTRLLNRFSIDDYVNCGATIFLFCYTTVTVAVVRSFNCVTVAPGVSLLFHSPTVNCDSDVYHAFLPISIVWLIIYVIGLPLGIWLLLHRHRAHLSNQDQEMGVQQSGAFGSVVKVDLKHSLNEPLQPFASPQNRIPLAEFKENEANIDEDDLEETNGGEVVEAPSASVISGRSFDVTLTSDGHRLTPFERRWGALFLPFKREIYYWSSWTLLRRCAFALTSVLLASASHSSGGPTTNLNFIFFSGLNVVSLLVHLSSEPYQEKLLNQLDTIAYFLLIVLSHVLLGATQPFSSAIYVIILLLIGPLSLFLLLSTFRLQLIQLRRRWKQFRTHQTQPSTAIPNSHSHSIESAPVMGGSMLLSASNGSVLSQQVRL